MQIHLTAEQIGKISDELFDFWGDELQNDEVIRKICRDDASAFSARFGLPERCPTTMQYVGFRHGCRAMLRYLNDYLEHSEPEEET